MRSTTSIALWATVGVLLIAGTSFGINRWLVQQAVEAGKPKADSIAAAQHAASAPEEDPQVEARRKQLSNLLDTVEVKLRNTPTDSMLVISAANLAYDLGDFEKAERYYSTFLEKIDPKNAQVTIDYGFVLFQRGKVDEGIAKVEGVVKSQPKNQTALYNLGIMHIRSNKPESALEWMKRCQKADPSSDVGKRAAAVIETLQHSS